MTTASGSSSGANVKTNDTAGVISALGNLPGASTALKAFLAAGGAGGTASTSTDIKQYKPQALTTTVNNIWRQERGRDATPKELDVVAKAVNAALRQAPSTTYTDGATNPANVTTTGTDVTDVIRQQALANPEAAKYQAATTYYDALLQAIRGPFGGGY